MSYDVFFKAKARDGYKLVGRTDINHTWNGSNMIKEIIGMTPGEFNGMKCSDLSPLLLKCIEETENNPEKYEQYMPDNKWGTVNSWLKFLKAIQDNCLKYPNAIVCVT